jgi:hypothetical protein
VDIEAEIREFVDGCHSRLEPPSWLPEIIAVPLETDREPGSPRSPRGLVVIRVDADTAPRPVMCDGTVPIRTHGSTVKADRERIAVLFAEEPRLTSRYAVDLPTPSLNRQGDGSTDIDLVLRGGVSIPMDPMATWRPLSERGISALAAALDKSRVVKSISSVTNGGISPSGLFDRHGFNRSNHARLARTWTSDPTQPPTFEVVAEVELSGAGGAGGGLLRCRLDVVVRLSAWTHRYNPSPPERWRCTIPELAELIEGLTASLVDDGVTSALAGLAVTDSAAVLPPSVLHFVTGPEVGQLLDPYGLSAIPGAGTSHGARVMADPTADLTDPFPPRRGDTAFFNEVYDGTKKAAA